MADKAIDKDETIEGKNDVAGTHSNALPCCAPVKVLNLYAGIGGNRKLWTDVEVTAVELDPKIAAIYQDFFPQDKVIVGDAHEYLLTHFHEFDFIWSSPPCPTHSRIRNEAGVGRGQNDPCYPDMTLYQQIIFLQHMFKMKDIPFSGKYVVENVVAYYKPLIDPQEVGHHYFWANYFIPEYKMQTRGHFLSNKDIANHKGFKISKDINDRKILRNCTEPELGLHIYNASRVKALF